MEVLILEKEIRTREMQTRTKVGIYKVISIDDGVLKYYSSMISHL